MYSICKYTNWNPHELVKKSFSAKYCTCQIEYVHSKLTPFECLWFYSSQCTLHDKYIV